jgi:hypothetical protein
MPNRNVTIFSPMTEPINLTLLNQIIYNQKYNELSIKKNREMLNPCFIMTMLLEKA